MEPQKEKMGDEVGEEESEGDGGGMGVRNIVQGWGVLRQSGNRS